MPTKHIVVQLSKLAFAQMTLATIAAYDVPQRKRTRGFVSGHECYGLLWGQQSIGPGGSPIYLIDFATVDTHAETSRNWVEPSIRFQQKMTECMSALFPSSTLVGEFHSHAHQDRATFTTPNLSAYDRAQLEDEADTKGLHKLGMRVFVVVSIYRLQRQSYTEPRTKQPNWIGWSIGHYRLIYAAYVALAAPRRGAAGLTIVPRHRPWPKVLHKLSRPVVVLTIGHGSVQRCQSRPE